MGGDGIFEARWWWRDRPVRVAVTERGVLATARRTVARSLAGQHAAERELARVHRAAGRPVPIGHLLRDLVAVALRAAEASRGAVDPTIGAPRLRASAEAVPAGASGWGRVEGGAGWRAVSLRGHLLAVPAPLWLDLGSTTTAYLVQRCAERVAVRHGAGVLVGVGSRVAVAGPAPARGWPVAAGPPRLTDGALVTADVLRADGGGVRDPRTGDAPRSPWHAVTVAAADAPHAAMLAVVALVRGADGPDWLAGQGESAWPQVPRSPLPQSATAHPA